MGCTLTFGGRSAMGFRKINWQVYRVSVREKEYSLNDVKLLFGNQNFVKYSQFHIAQANLQVNNMMQKICFKFSNNNNSKKKLEEYVKQECQKLLLKLGNRQHGVHCLVLSTHVCWNTP